MELVLTERTEAVIPFVYMITLLMAFYGPNADILGSIKLEIWHYQTIMDDIGAALFNIGLLWIADLMSLVGTTILMWKFCDTNVFKVLLKLQKKFWFQMAVCEGLLMVEVISKFHLLIVVLTFYILGVYATCHWKWTRSYTPI